MGITLNLTAEDDDEHEPHVKRFNKTIKERCRMGITRVPFTTLPKRIVVELISAMIY